jgi:hypothetical protein
MFITGEVKSTQLNRPTDENLASILRTDHKRHALLETLAIRSAGSTNIANLYLH